MLKIAVVGATGLIGRSLLNSLQWVPGIEAKNILIAASERSQEKGKPIKFKNYPLELSLIWEIYNCKPDVVVILAGDKVSEEWTPKFIEQGARVICNSAIWRRRGLKSLAPHPGTVWELNPDKQFISIANPASYLVAMAIEPLLKFNPCEINATVLEPISSAGTKAMNAFFSEKDHHRSVHSELLSPVMNNIQTVSIENPKSSLHSFEEEAVDSEVINLLNLVRHFNFKSRCNLGPQLYSYWSVVRVNFDFPHYLEKIKDLFMSRKYLIYDPVTALHKVMHKKHLVISRMRFVNSTAIEFEVTGDNTFFLSTYPIMTVLEKIIEKHLVAEEA